MTTATRAHLIASGAIKPAPKNALTKADSRAIATRKHEAALQTSTDRARAIIEAAVRRERFIQAATDHILDCIEA